MKSELGQRIDTLVKKAGLVELIKSEAKAHFAYYDKIDEAFDAGNDDLVDELMDKQELLMNTIKAKIQEHSPIDLEDLVLKNFAASAIDQAIQ